MLLVVGCLLFAVVCCFGPCFWDGFSLNGEWQMHKISRFPVCKLQTHAL